MPNPSTDDVMLALEEAEFLGTSGDPAYRHPRMWIYGAGVTTILLGAVIFIPFRLFDVITRQTSQTLEMWTILVAVLVMIALTVRLQIRMHQLGRLQLTCARDTVATGQTLKGHVRVQLKQRQAPVSIGLNLTLQIRSLEGSGEGGSTWTWRDLGHSSALLASQSAFEANAVEELEFSLPAPRCDEENYTGSLALLEKIDWQTVQRKKALRWLFAAELIGLRGMLLQSTKRLKVTGAHRRNWVIDIQNRLGF